MLPQMMPLPWILVFIMIFVNIYSCMLFMSSFHLSNTTAPKSFKVSSSPMTW